MALALLVAQAINFGLVFNERQRATRNQIEGPPVARFVAFAQRAAPLAAAAAAAADRRTRPPARPLLVRRAERSSPAQDNDERITARLRDQADRCRPADPRRARRGQRRCRRRRRASATGSSPDAARARRGADCAASRPCASRSSSRTALAQRPAGHAAAQSLDLAVRLAGSTLLIYLLLLGAIVLIALRLGRPLKDLTAAAKSFEGRGEAPQVDAGRARRRPPRHHRLQRDERARLDHARREGPDAGRDRPRHAHAARLAAHPRREHGARSGAREDDRHHRGDGSRCSSETLALARAGRATEQVRPVDLHALADALVEEFRDLGPARRDGSRASATSPRSSPICCAGRCAT